MSPQQGANSPEGEEPHWPRPADDEAAPSEAGSAEWVEEGVPRNPVFMDMDLPGITDTGVAGNLVTRRVCLPKAVYPLICSNPIPPRLLPKRQVNSNHLLEALITKSFAET